MISYTRLNVLTITFVFTIATFIFIDYFILNYNNSIQIYEHILNQFRFSEVSNTDNQETPKVEVKNNQTENKVENVVKNAVNGNLTPQENKIVTNATTTLNKISNTLYGEQTWKIIIPVIGLEAEIAEGTTDNIMNQYVGHFEGTGIITGNVGLAAHNRGYPVNYFQNIKDLQMGDEIEYIANGISKTYRIDVIAVIQDTDWMYLQNTKDNRITLITCVEDKPELRRCIQGVEI